MSHILTFTNIDLPFKMLCKPGVSLTGFIYSFLGIGASQQSDCIIAMPGGDITHWV